MRDSVRRARALLTERTPLKYDCGALCENACCKSDEDGQGGVWLLPGEAEALPGAAWARVEAGAPPTLLCQGPCAREDRPFFCRLFPLVGVRRGGAWDVRLDRRAWAMCPLMDGGMRALDPAFVDAAREAVKILAADGEIAPILARWARIERQFARCALPEADDAGN